jgi:hypothetical protein
MFFGGDVFWMLMGVILVLIGFAFKAFAEDRGWVLTWWKGLLALIWYGMVCMSLYTYGTLAGENEASAGLKIMLFGLVICLILGVGLWRLMGVGSKSAKKSEA